MRSRPWVEVLNGFCLVFSLHLGFLALALFLLSFVGSDPKTVPGLMFFWFSTFLGLSQFLYVAPIMVLYWERRRVETVKGMAIASIVTMLLNGSCYIKTPPELHGIQVFIGVCIAVLSLFILFNLAAWRR